MPYSRGADRVCRSSNFCDESMAMKPLKCVKEYGIAPMHDYVRRVNFTNKPRL